MKQKIFATLLCSMAICFAGCKGQPDVFPYKDAKLPAEVRTDDLLKRMTLDEKINQLRHLHGIPVTAEGELDTVAIRQKLHDHGIGFVENLTLSGREAQHLMNDLQRYMRQHTRLGIPVFTVAEALHGSVHDGSTIFPQAIALGSTFNTDLAYRMAEATAEELRMEGMTQILSPVIDVCRELRWGRVEECLGEDPFLVSRMGVAQVKAYLNNGISPMLKHFGAHGMPQGGLNLASVACGQRDLLSVFLKPFETVVKEAGPWAVMSSYNSWNGEPNSSSHYLLTELLRDQWGFKGYVYSDWGAIGMLNYFHHSAGSMAEAAVQALTAGLDVEASDNCYSELKQLVESGQLDMDYIDCAVRRVLLAKFSTGLFDYELSEEKDFDQAVHTDKHINLAREIAEESVVLLKNEKNLLPLDFERIRSVALIGPNAGQVQFGDYTWSRDNRDGVTLLEALRQTTAGKVRINYAQGCDGVSPNRDGFAQAVTAARNSDVCIVVVGTASASLARDYSNATCGEGFDLSELSLPGVQEELVREVYATGKPVIVVLLAGKPLAIPWIKEHIPAILVQWYPGEQGGNALADVLSGKVNPSGRLNYSFPQSTGHLPCFYNYLPTDKGFYKRPGSAEKPGRDYVFASPAALWPFGYGLSYTTFAYSNLRTNKEDYGVSDTIRVELDLSNEGACRGKEVVQVYVRDVVSSIVTPVRQLKAFSKIDLEAGTKRTVSLCIPVSELGFYNRDMEYTVEPGEFELQIGASSEDIRLTKTITVDRRNMKHTLVQSEKQEEEKKEAAPSVSVVVSGVVSDVQANPQEGIRVAAGELSVYTDKAGRYSIKVGSADTLSFSGKSFDEVKIPVDGHEVIDVRLRMK